MRYYAGVPTGNCRVQTAWPAGKSAIAEVPFTRDHQRVAVVAMAMCGDACIGVSGLSGAIGAPEVPFQGSHLVPQRVVLGAGVTPALGEIENGYAQGDG